MMEIVYFLALVLFLLPGTILCVGILFFACGISWRWLGGGCGGGGDLVYLLRFCIFGGSIFLV